MIEFGWLEDGSYTISRGVAGILAFLATRVPEFMTWEGHRYGQGGRQSLELWKEG